MIDAYLAPYRWYRRRTGGTWYFVRDPDPVDGGWTVWTRALRPDDDILDVESYG